MIVIDSQRIARYGWNGPPVRWVVETLPCGCKYVIDGTRLVILDKSSHNLHGL